jgi:outer membrane protein assembly factor BamA
MVGMANGPIANARPRRECRAGGAALLLALLLALPTAHAQENGSPNETASLAAPPPDTTQARGTRDGRARWRLVVDGERRAWRSVPALPLDSLRAAARAAVRHVQAQGHYRARLDSAVIDSGAAGPPQARLHVHAGPLVEVGRIRFAGNRTFSGKALRALMETRPGRPLRQDVLKADLRALLRRYEEEGFPLARARLDSVRLTGSAPPRLALTITIDEGAAPRLSRVTVESEGRTRPAFVARTAGLETGTPLAGYDPAAVRERLRKTNLFERVGEPELLLAPESPDSAGTRAVVRVPVEEKSPATFDLALGYLPPSGDRGGRLVGSGSLALRSPFGAGRTAALRLDRRPGALSRFEVEATNPFVGGTPLRLALAFEGLQEDSTYGRQRYRLGAGYRVGRGLHVRAEVSREVTRPGIAGRRLAAPAGGGSAGGGSAGGGRRQRVAWASSWFGGAGVRLRRLRGPTASPRGGLRLDADVSLGRKARRARRVPASGSDTLRTDRTLTQQRFECTARAYLALRPRQVLAFGADASLLMASDRYDRSDLFFLGGARSLRGYDEDRFRGHVVGRALAEYRYLLGRRSFAYAFLDVGHARRPALPGASVPQSGWHPGFGVGLQFESALGLVKAGYALNDEDGPDGGRVHIGLVVGG